MNSLIIRRLILPILFLSSVCYANPSEVKCKFFFKGMPVGAPDTNILIIRDIYALSADKQTKFADWVAYRLDKETIGTRAIETGRVWKADPWLKPEDTLEPEDYANANTVLKVDRGHQAPLASFRGTPYWDETNYLSNITPQQSALNQGAWVKLEEDERALVKEGNILYVMTGPLYEKMMPPLPRADEPHKVPSGYWKIIVVESSEDSSSFQTAAFIFDQITPKKDSVSKHIVTIDEVEKRSGFDFLRDLPVDQESKVESNSNKEWIHQNIK